MSERERAEQLLENLRSIVELHSGDIEEMIGVTLAFAREERARVWEGAAELANAMPMATSHNVAVRLKLVARRLREEP